MTKDVPSELVRDILSLLPVKSLVRFKSIPKAWKSEVEDPIFVKSHLLRQSTRPDSTHKILFLQKSRGNKLFLADNVDLLDHAVEIKPNFNGKMKDFDDLILVGSCNGLACFVDTRESCIILWNISVDDYKYILLPKNKKLALNGVQFHVYGFGYDSVNDDYKPTGIFVSGTVHWLGFKHGKMTLIDAVDLARERSVVWRCLCLTVWWTCSCPK
ncbi:hypothetical protein SLEP1_g52426 [Rubroshorea leprosula]|uniref:F-box domain-containing protein n=1 Tax=Rubroshorea leprosula TaxID=152421 RepID=A0AAV5M667_9ROSI|nr:hypothetical protein SLEP1_g52426 [Rubroshorea leprosula]